MGAEYITPFGQAPLATVGLRYDEGRDDNRPVDAYTTNNDEGRIFLFTADIETILTEQLAIHEKLKAAGTICPFVFRRNGERIGYFRVGWKNACKTAGCPGALVHDMRRSAVRTFEHAGVPRSVLMSLVGHRTESIYRRYTIVDEAMQREAAARLDGCPSRSSINGHRHRSPSR